MRWRLLAAVSVLLAGLAALPASAAARATPQPGAVRLLAQTPWIETRGIVRLRVALSGPAAADRIEVLGFDRLINRTNFRSAASGHVNGYSIYSPVTGISSLPADPAGGFDIDVPVNTRAPAGSPFPTFTVSATGVYPLQIRLLNAAGVAQGSPLTTFLVYATGPKDATPLSVSLIVPFSSPPVLGRGGHIQAPSAAEAARLNRLAEMLSADTRVHLSVLANPETLTALRVGAASGSTVDRQTLASLAEVPHGGLIQLLPTTYSAVSLGDLQQAGLGGEIDQQLEVGADTIKEVFGVAPETSTWAVDGPLGSSTAAAAVDHRASSFIVPDGDLSRLPPYATEVTFASTTSLALGDARAQVMAADPGLTSDFGSSSSPVLSANRMLAEMAMIESELPGKVRGVVAMPPAGWTVSPEFVGTLLSGLAGDPLLEGVTATGLFSSVPGASITRELSSPFPAPGARATALSEDAGLIAKGRADVSLLSSILPASSPRLDGLGQLLLESESETVTRAQRRAIIGSITASARGVSRAVSLPSATSITLTATRGQLPVTILAQANLHPKVELELTSQKLIFLPFRTSGGSCRIPTPTREICLFVLTSQNTTLKVPVEARSTGSFPLDIEVLATDGSVLAHDHDTVRSTAVSGVGVILIALAVLSLALWWGRDLRRGRRSRKLAPSPVSDLPGIPDEQLTELFTSPPPDVTIKDGHRSKSADRRR